MLHVSCLRHKYFLFNQSLLNRTGPLCREKKFFLYCRNEKHCYVNTTCYNGSSIQQDPRDVVTQPLLPSSHQHPSTVHHLLLSIYSVLPYVKCRRHAVSPRPCLFPLSVCLLSQPHSLPMSLPVLVSLPRSCLFSVNRLPMIVSFSCSRLSSCYITEPR